MRKFFLPGFLLLLFFSCNSFLRIEKRRYTKGYYVSISKDQVSSYGKNNTENKTFVKQVVTDSAVSGIFNTERKPVIKPDMTSVAGSPAKKCQQHKIHPAKNDFSLKELEAKSNHIIYGTRTKKDLPSNKNISLSLILLLGSAMGFCIAGICKYQQGSLLKVSAWGHKNKWKTRFISTAIRIALSAGSFWAGAELFNHHFIISNSQIFLLAALYFLSILIYPFKKSSYDGLSWYVRRKWHDLVLSLTGLALVFGLGNQVAADQADRMMHSFFFQHLISKPKAKQEQVTIAFPDKTTGIKSAADEEQTYALRTLLTIFVIISTIVLEVLVLALSCGAACSGEEGLAALIAIGGTAIVVLALVYSIRGIRKLSPE